MPLPKEDVREVNNLSSILFFCRFFRKKIAIMIISHFSDRPVPAPRQASPSMVFPADPPVARWVFICENFALICCNLASSMSCMLPLGSPISSKSISSSRVADVYQGVAQSYYFVHSRYFFAKILHISKNLLLLHRN